MTTDNFPKWMTMAGAAALVRGYYCPGESNPRELYTRLANTAAQLLDRADLAPRFFNMLWRGWLGCASPVLANFGHPRGLPISCFGIHPDDSVDSLFMKVHEQAMMSKNGGGVGIGLSDIRGRGEAITYNGTSEGVVPWAKVYDSTVAAVSQGCYDAETEILTERGWARFSALQRDVRVAQVNDEGQTEWVLPTDYMQYEVAEDLYHVSTKVGSVDLLVTGNHTMVIRRRRRVSNKRDENGRFVNHEKVIGALETVRADEVKYHRDVVHTLTSASSVVGAPLTPFERVLIAFQADGGEAPTGNSTGEISGHLIHGFRFTKERKIKRLRELLDGASLDYSENKHVDGVTSFLVQFPRESPPKHFSEWVDLREFSQEKAAAFMDELRHWDASSRTTTSHGFMSTYEEDVDVAHALAILAGYQARKSTKVRDAPRKPLHTLFWVEGHATVGGEAISVRRESYKGTVYCVEVPSHRLVVRRNGAVSVCGNSTRRGASSVNLSVWHPDIEEFLNIRRPHGDPNHQCLNLHHCVVVDDRFMRAVEEGSPRERALWIQILKTRLETGEPYIMFSEAMNADRPQYYIDNDMAVSMTNICTEISLFTDPMHSFVCCLSSLNLGKYDEWKDTDTVELSVYFLDAVMQDFLNRAAGMPGLENAVRAAAAGRPLGLGVMGWHTLLQKRGYAFDSFAAMTLNAQVFRQIAEQANDASRALGAKYGEPEWCRGTGRRNTHLTAIAPTISNALIAGEMSEGIAPRAANAYTFKTAKGTFFLQNEMLRPHLAAAGLDTTDVWQDIAVHDGSVQHLPLPEEIKQVFLTAPEINQMALVRQAGQRQRWIEQGQSLNLFFPAQPDPKWFNRVHLTAWDEGVKTLYYVRTSSVLRADVASRAMSEDCAACEG